jgi:hypothetical protein
MTAPEPHRFADSPRLSKPQTDKKILDQKPANKPLALLKAEKIMAHYQQAEQPTTYHTGAHDMTKQEQKQINRATAQGRGALLRTLAIIHRAGSTRTQKQITTMIDEAGAQDEFTMVNGALLHKAEGTAALLNT